MRSSRPLQAILLPLPLRVAALVATTVLSSTAIAKAAAKPAARPTDHGSSAPPASFVPEALRPWIPWVLETQEPNHRCPFVYNDAKDLRCDFPSRLELDLNQAGGSFRLTVERYVANFQALPGDDNHWPLEVSLDGAPAAVLTQNGAPSVDLPLGQHVITGRFYWQTLPEGLNLPKQTGLVALKVNGSSVTELNLQPDGKLWLHRAEQAPAEDEGLEVRVHRLLTDAMPITLTTQLSLDVSGKSRELILGPVLPAHLLPMRIDSAKPARLDSNGLLHLQAGPGHWSVTVVARAAGQVQQIGPAAAPKPWPEHEVWSFAAQPGLRQVEVQGATSLDPSQTGMPDSWRQYPAYRLGAGETLTLKETSRGDDPSRQDQLRLSRSWWLDFDGKGYTIQDSVVGDVSRSWRLAMSGPVQLGRVAVSGKDQFITQMESGHETGVELRRGALNLVADSRLNGPASSLPAIGWDHDFQKVSGMLNLPPGWRLLAATGVDQASGTWVGAWALMSFFLLLIVSLGLMRLRGRSFGILAFVTLLLTISEPDSPQFLWLAGLASLALAKYVTHGKAQRLVQLYQVGFALTFAMTAMPFVVSQIHQAIYPSLEHADQQIEQEAVATDDLEEPGETAVMKDGAGGAPPSAPLGAASEGLSNSYSRSESGKVMRKAAAPRPQAQERQALNDYDPKANVQTGPGLPAWQWRRSTLTWNGPVERHQSLHFWLIPPWLNLFLGLARGLLTLVLGAVMVLGPPAAGSWRRLVGWLSTPRRGAVLMALALLTQGAATRAKAADFPSKDILDQLAHRLIKDPSCLPECAAVQRMIVDFDARTLRLRLDVDSGASVVMPLPGRIKEWSPDVIKLDGQDNINLSRDDSGVLWLRVSAGHHQLQLSGPLPSRDAVQLNLPLKPHQVSTSGHGWVLLGLHEDGVVDQTLELKRERSGHEEAGTQVQATTLPPFLEVQRNIVLDLAWTVQTRVIRQTPSDTAVVIRLPLIPGEAVTSAGVHTEGAEILINMPAGADEVSWSSVLTPTASLTLKASSDASWFEVWRFNVSPIWHATFSGLPELAAASDESATVPTWRPWPGETLTAKLAKPAGVEGQSVTIDKSALSLSPGLRATDFTLDLSLRSSRGGQHDLILAKGADLQTFTVDGKAQSLHHEGDKLTIPLTPGKEEIHLAWRQPTGIEAFYRSKGVNLGLPSVNASVLVQVPPDRWVLWASGPRLGPAVLFWGTFLALLLVAVLLGRVPLTPLRTHDWFLLGLGLTQTSVGEALVLVSFFLALGWRRHGNIPKNAWLFDALQIALCILGAYAIGVLVDAVQLGFLGTPSMQITGNASTSRLLRWYQDRLAGDTPAVFVLSVPMLVYRLAMLLWALWLARFVLTKASWIWQAYSAGGIWRRPRLAPVAAGSEGTDVPRD